MTDADSNVNSSDDLAASVEAVQAARLLRVSADLAAFERDLGVEQPAFHFVAMGSAVVTSPTLWSPTKRIALATAACVLVGVIVWLVRPMHESAQPARNSDSDLASAPMVAPPLHIEPPQPSGAPPSAPPIVHQVVALYRGDVDVEGRCPDCWCVAQWSPSWGEGRGANDLHEDELVQASLKHACVTDPQRVVIVGLTGPANAMPKTDAEALEMSLCLLKKQSTQFPVSLVDNTSAYCIPTGVDYCMTTWDK